MGLAGNGVFAVVCGPSPCGDIVARMDLSIALLAITEFLNNPDGADKGREWVELFNYGPDV